MKKLNNSGNENLSDGVTQSGPVIGKIIFGTDGWRGLLGDELNDRNIQRVARAFVRYLKLKSTHQRVVIGYDGRKNSDTFALLFAMTLMDSNIEVLLSDRVVPTPVVSFTCIHQKCDAGVMITASHNPPQYNGIKFKSANGSPFATDQTAMVESFIEDYLPSTKEIKIPFVDLTSDYLIHIEKLIDFSAIKKSGITVAIDSMAGAGGAILEDLLKKNGIGSETIFGKPEANFAGRLAEPVERNLQPLSSLLKQGDFSLGVATDGDADRLGVMTDKGNWMNVQETILYLAQYYKGERGVEGPLVKTASVTDRLLELFPGSDVADVQVGFKYVAEAMMEEGASFGAEESGGFGFKEHLPERDGIFSSLVFIEMLAKSGHTQLENFMAAKRKELGDIFYDRIDMENNHPERHNILPRMAAHPPSGLADFQVTGLQTYINSRGLINGLKLRFEGNPRWLLLRVSETEPIVRIYAEGQNEAEVKHLLEAGQKILSV